jgi:3D (Asp-Asp-Asp) domain-containing protein
VRVGAPIIAAVALGFLLPAAEGAEQAAPQPTAAQAQEPAPDRINAYARLTRRALALRDERRSVQLALAVARRSLARSERRLGARLRALYEHGRPDPLEVVLGARSLDDAIVSVERLERIARDEADQVRELRRARRTLETLAHRLRAREAEAAALRAQAAAVVHALAARTVMGRPAPQTDEAAPNPPAAPPQSGARLITVVATGYSIAGATATGLPAGVGTVAVDPGVIPLGTALTIPDYGKGVAADTGGSIRGASIDLWFPTRDQARAWGRRVVTIEVDFG